MSGLKNPNSDHWEQFPDRNERLCFDMDSGGVRFNEMESRVEFDDFDELPQFEKKLIHNRKFKNAFRRSKVSQKNLPNDPPA
jgi:hypothetical protein